MWVDLIKERDILEIPNNITFGLEIEFAKANRRYIAERLNLAYKNKKISNPWNLENEETIYDDNIFFSNYGGEAISAILTDNKNTWNDIEFTCGEIKNYGGIINKKCGAHVHTGISIFEDNLKYYSRLMKIWTIFENIIIRFCYGEFNNPRENFCYFAAYNTPFFKNIDLFYKNDKQLKSFDEFVAKYSKYKTLAVSFQLLDEKYIKNKYGNNIKDWYKYRTLEFRAGNGTLNPVIWQNYVNLYTKIMLCCLDDSKDWDYIDKEFYNNILNDDIEIKYNLNKAQLFFDFIFNNPLDKYNFLVQYSKNEDKISYKSLVRKNK